IADLMWPDRHEGEARANLRSILHRLRSVLGADVVATREAIGLSLDVRFDAVEFEELVKNDRLSDAWGAYDGEFLAGFYLDGSAEFESWLTSEQVRFRSMAVEVGQRLLSERLAADDHRSAVDVARRLIDLEPT